MKEALTFNDVLIQPRFSEVNSRKDVSLDNGYFKLPVVSANMDSVTDHVLAKAMLVNGAMGCLHRFWSIKDNVEAFENSIYDGRSPWVSVGVGENEYERAVALYEAGARVVVLDVAHGASQKVVDQYNRIKGNLLDVQLVVGNFATKESILQFIHACGYNQVSDFTDIIKVGIGPGSSCQTRVKTGIGVPQLSALIDCSSLGVKLIADGGLKNPGDCAKALSIKNVMAVMVGNLLAGTLETPGEIVEITGPGEYVFEPTKYKNYHGSASKESYDAQGKDSSYITAEGESFLVEYKGPVADVLNDIAGGLRSAFSYVGAHNLKEFQQNAEFIRVTHAGYLEGLPHGKKT